MSGQVLERPAPGWRHLLLAGAVCCGIGAGKAVAQGITPPDRTGGATGDAAAAGAFGDILGRDTLLGDMGGLRTWLGDHGVTLTLTDESNVLGNASGGFDKGTTYNALTTLTLQMDTQKAFGWDGGTINLSGLQIRGRSLSQYYLANLQTVSSIAASPTTRLWEIWYQQAFGDGAADVKLGQQSIDQEFLVSKESGFYINAMMGWPILPAADLYAGGPSYPLSSLGLRFRAQPSEALTLLAGVFQDNPPGGSFNNDSQLLGSTRWGGNFNLRTGALFIAEAQYAINQPAKDGAGPPGGLPGVYKIGAWFDTGAFPNERYDTMGLSLANPASNGMPRMDQHNASIYGLVDQTVWRPDPRGGRSVSVFARALGAPDDHNLISFSVNAGVNLHAPLPDRDDDILGVGFGLAKVSGFASDLSRDMSFYATSLYPVPVRGSETFLEVTYLIQVTPWLLVQPDFQYIFNPGGGIPNPGNSAQRIQNEAVFGFRTGVTF